MSETVPRPDDRPHLEPLYTQQTGASRADFYRRKREVDSGELDEHDAQ